jgi:outer membrane lipoprotein carrier protein
VPNFRLNYRLPSWLVYGSPLSLICIAFFVLCGVHYTSAAETTDPQKLFELRYQPARSLSVIFLERFLENGQVMRKEAGTAYFLRPGKMRWEYEKPEKNLFLVDGKYVWFYAPADRTVTRVPADKSEDWRTPVVFLTSGVKLSRICAKVERVTSESASQPNAFVYSCILKNQDASSGATSGAPSGAGNEARPIYFEISDKGELTRLKMDEGAGQALEFLFHRWEFNPSLDKSMFTFDPPWGVTIVNGLLPEVAGTRQK